MSKKTGTDDVSEFEATVAELESFGKAYASKQGKATMGEKPMLAEEDDETEGSDQEEDEADMMPMKKAKVPATQEEDEPNAMAADDFIQKSHALFVGSMEKSMKPQKEAMHMLIKAFISQGKMLKSLIPLQDEVATLREAVSEMGRSPNVRKSTLSLHDRQPSGSTSPDAQVPAGAEIPVALLAKAHGPSGLLLQGILTPATIGVLEHCANRQQPLPPHMGHLAQYAN